MRRLLPALLAAAVLPVHATTYVVESHHTQGVIRWDHMGFSHPTAQFTRVEGTLVFDPARPTESRVHVTIPMAALGTGVPDLDADFRSAAFFDYAKYPVARFRSRTVEAARDGKHFRVTGDLTLHGATRTVALDAVLNRIGTNLRSGVGAIGFEATTHLKRSDFGLGRFVPIVGDRVEIHITVEADEAKGLIAYLERQAASATSEADRKDFAQAAEQARKQAMDTGD